MYIMKLERGPREGKKFNKGEWKDELNTCNMELERRERIQGRNIPREALVCAGGGSTKRKHI